MSSGFYGPEGFGSSPFDEFLARLYGGGSGQPRPVHRVDIMRLMSGPARELLGAAAAHATQQGDADLGTKHLLWAAADLEPTRQLLARAGADPAALARAADGQERGAPGGTGEHSVNGAAAGGGPSQLTPPQLTPGAKRALLDAHQISRSLGSTYIGAEHILFALAVNPESGAGRILSAARVTPDVLRGALLAQGVPPAQGGPPGSGGRSATPALDEFGRDLTALAREGRIDPVIGRDEEIDQTVEVLSRRTKNNPVLIGEAGVGKTAIVEGIAQRVVDDDVPETLAGSRVVQLELSGVVAGTRYRGDFEERVKRIIDEIRDHGSELIVFIDELHTIVGAGAGSEGGMDAGNMLKPCPRRAARDRRHDAGRVPKGHRAGRRAGPQVPADPGVGADRRRRDRDPARAAGPVRGAPPGPLLRRSAGRRRRALRPVHHRPIPAGQGDRPHRSGGRPGSAAHRDPRRRPAQPGAAGRRAAAGQGSGGRQRTVRTRFPAAG